MSLPLPNLDDRTFADLMEQARSLIPAYDPKWTDHNPSDPGITLLECFAWLTEMLIYRTNRIPEQHLIAFLRLLNGPAWQPGTDLSEDIRASVGRLRQPYRAVTVEDYEQLTREGFSDEIARVICIPRRDLGAGTEPDRLRAQPGHMSLIIVPYSSSAAPQPSDQLRQRVWEYLEPRRILTTRHHVVGPVYAPVSADMLIARRSDVPVEKVQAEIVQELESFLSPIPTGSNQAGWPFGRDVFVSEIYERLEKIPGVDYVPEINLSSQCLASDDRCVEAGQVWHESGDLIGLSLAAHHLPRARIDPTRLVIGDTFVPAQVTVAATPNPDTSHAEARRAIKTQLRRFFNPLYGWTLDKKIRRDGRNVWVVTDEAIRTEMRNVSAIQSIGAIQLSSDPDHQITDEAGNGALLIQEWELVDIQVNLELLSS